MRKPESAMLEELKQEFPGISRFDGVWRVPIVRPGLVDAYVDFSTVRELRAWFRSYERVVRRLSRRS